MISKRIKSPQASSLFLQKGFLFTLSVILFASTLVVFSQAFVENNTLEIRAINSSSKPLAALLLNDDLAFDLTKIFDFSIDLNEHSFDTITISGSIPSNNDFHSRLNSYYNFIDKNFFRRISETKYIYLSDLNDGKAEVFLGNSFEYDFNYDANKISFFPINASTLEGLDINVDASGSLTTYSWSPSAGSVPITIDYSDDINHLSISANISPTSASTLTVNYSSGSMLVLIGSISGTNNSFSVQSNNFQKVDYSIKADYTNPGLLRPVKLNAFVYYSGLDFDSNSMLIVKK